MSLIFDENNYTVRKMEAEGQAVSFRAFENITTVGNPIDSSCQQISVYVPEDFFSGKNVNGWDIRSAPIFFEVDMGGFFPSSPKRPEDPRFRRTSIFFYCLQHGMVVVSCGCRGRMSRDREGNLCGKLPAAIADCKMALKYIHFNRERFPGDTEKIIVSGTSAGGGVAVHMGLYGSNGLFEDEFRKSEAAPAPCTVLGVATYCPVTDLAHADMAYEWQFDGIYDYHRMAMNMDEGGRPHFSKEDGVLDAERQALSKELAGLFSEYVNHFLFLSPVGRPLVLNNDGSGSFADWMLEKLRESALAKGENPPETLYSHMQAITRMKLAPAFDDITMGSFENNAFGDSVTDYAHFTRFSYTHSRAALPVMADKKTIFMSDPHNFMNDSKEMAEHFRIRQGTLDRDIGMGSVALITLHLLNAGVETEYGLDWGEVHGGDYDTEALLGWIDRITL